MTTQAGRTHTKYIGFFLDNSGGTLTDLTAHHDSPGTFGLTHGEQDVTGMNNAVQNVVIGRPSAPLTIVFKYDTVLMAHLMALDHVTPLTLDVRVGIRHAWESGEPCFGITSSATSGYLFKDFTTDGEKVTATFNVFGAVAPDFSTTAHT